MLLIFYFLISLEGEEEGAELEEHASGAPRFFGNTGGKGRDWSVGGWSGPGGESGGH